MINETYLQSLSHNERLDVLSNHADRTESGDYFKRFSEEDLIDERKKFTDQSIELSKLQDELDKFKALMKIKMKPIQEEVSRQLSILRNKGLSIESDLFYIANHESGMMDIYAADGTLVETRRLRPDEKQTTLKIANFKS